MLERIEAKKAYKRFELALATHNESCPERIDFRTVQTSVGPKRVEVVRKEGTIKQAVKETFWVVLTQYIHSYNTVASYMPAGMYTTQDPPSLLTNHIRLAEVCGCSDRTVRNHLDKLRKLGVLRTKWHGRQKNIELWISLEVLWGGEGEKFEKMRPGGLETQLGKNFPPNNTYGEKYEIRNKNADMCVEHGANDHGERGRTENGLSLQSEVQESPALDAQSEEGSGAGRAEKIAQNEHMRVSRASQLMDERTPRMPDGIKTRYLNLLIDFWIYAMKMLYPERDFSKEEQEKALVAIAAGVYNNFTDERTDQEWLDYQVMQLTKIDMAARYFERHQKAYPPEPFSMYKPGKGYFDRENLRGFGGLTAWVQRGAAQRAMNREAYAAKKTNRDAYYTKLLGTARRDFEKMKAGLPARKGMDNMSLMQLYQHWLVVFRGFGRKWEERFMQQYVDAQARNFSPPKIHRPQRQRALADTPSPATVVYVQSYMEGDGQGYYSSI